MASKLSEAITKGVNAVKEAAASASSKPTNSAVTQPKASIPTSAANTSSALAKSKAIAQGAKQAKENAPGSITPPSLVSGTSKGSSSGGTSGGSSFDWSSINKGVQAAAKIAPSLVSTAKNIADTAKTTASNLGKSYQQQLGMVTKSKGTTGDQEEVGPPLPPTPSRSTPERKRDTRTWMDIEGTTGKSRIREKGTYLWEGHYTEDGAWVNGVWDWYDDNTNRYQYLVTQTDNKTWQDEKTINSFAQEAANLYWDYDEIGTWFRDTAAERDAARDSMRFSSKEEADYYDAYTDVLLRNAEAADEMKEYSDNLYQYFAELNKWYGEYDDSRLIDAEDGKNYKGGNTPDEIRALMLQVDSTYDKFGGRKSHEETTKEYEALKDELVEAEARQKEIEENNRRVIAGRKYLYTLDDKLDNISFETLETLLDTAETDDERTYIQGYIDAKNYYSYVDKWTEASDEELRTRLNQLEYGTRTDPSTGTTTTGKTSPKEALKEYSFGGNVDLTKRPTVDASKLSAAGWTDVGEGQATVFSSTYSNAKGDKAGNFTPIVVDSKGKLIDILSPSHLQKYAEAVLSGEREDNLGLQIGATFEGKDAIGEATKTAEKIHDLYEQEAQEPEGNAFKEFFSSLFSSAKDVIESPQKRDDLSREEELEIEAINSIIYKKRQKYVSDQLAKYSAEFPAGKAAEQWAKDARENLLEKQKAYQAAENEVRSEDYEHRYDFAFMALNAVGWDWSQITDEQLENSAALRELKAAGLDPNNPDIDGFLEGKRKEAADNLSKAEEELETAREEYAFSQMYSDYDVQKSPDFPEGIEEGKKIVESYGGMEGLYEALENADTMLDKKYGLKQAGITGEEAAELANMLNTLGVSADYLVPRLAPEGGDLTSLFKARDEEVGTFTDTQLKHYYYLLGTEGIVAASEYAIGVNSILNKEYIDQRHELYLQVKDMEMRHKSGVGRVAQILADPWAGGLMSMTGIADTIKYADQIDRLGRTIVADTPSLSERAEWIGESAHQQIDKYVQKPGWRDAWSFLYDAYSSSVQSVETQVVGSVIANGLLGVLGLSGTAMMPSFGGSAAGKTVHEFIAGAFSDLTFFGSAAASTYRELTDRGIDPEDALNMSLFSGVAEAAFEHISFEQLYHAKDVSAWNSWLDVARETIISGGIEGSEELFTNWANHIGQTLFIPENTDYWTKYYDYKYNRGFSDEKAKQLATHDIVMEDALAFFSGAVSSSMSVTPTHVVSYSVSKNNSEKTRTEIGNRYSAYKDNSGKSGAQLLGEYLKGYTFIEDGKESLYTKDQINAAKNIQTLATKAANGTATAEEIGKLHELADSLNSKAIDEFVLQNGVWYAGVSGGRLWQVATEANVLLLGEDEAKAYANAVANNPDARVISSFEEGLIDAGIGDAEQRTQVATFVKQILMGDGRLSPEQIQSAFQKGGLLSNSKVQKFVFSHLQKIKAAGAEFIAQGRAKQAESATPVIPTKDQFEKMQISKANFSLPEFLSQIGVRDETVAEDLFTALTGAWSTARQADYNMTLMQAGMDAFKKELDRAKDTLRNDRKESRRAGTAYKGSTKTDLSQYRNDKDSVTIGDKTVTRDEFVKGYLGGEDIIRGAKITGKPTAGEANDLFDMLILNNRGNDNFEGVKSSSSMVDYDLEKNEPFKKETKTEKKQPESPKEETNQPEPKPVTKNGPKATPDSGNRTSDAVIQEKLDKLQAARTAAIEAGAGDDIVKSLDDKIAELTKTAATGTDTVAKGKTKKRKGSKAVTDSRTRTSDAVIQEKLDKLQAARAAAVEASAGDDVIASIDARIAELVKTAATGTDTVAKETKGTTKKRNGSKAVTDSETRTSDAVIQEKLEKLQAVRTAAIEAGAGDDVVASIDARIAELARTAATGKDTVTEEPPEEPDRIGIDEIPEEELTGERPPLDNGSTVLQPEEAERPAPVEADTLNGGRKGEEEPRETPGLTTEEQPTAPTGSTIEERIAASIGYDDMDIYDRHNAGIDTDESEEESYTPEGADSYTPEDVREMVDLAESEMGGFETIDPQSRTWEDTVVLNDGREITRAEFVANEMSGMDALTGEDTMPVSGTAANDSFDALVDSIASDGGTVSTGTRTVVTDTVGGQFSMFSGDTTPAQRSRTSVLAAAATAAALENEILERAKTNRKITDDLAGNLNAARTRVEEILKKKVSDVGRSIRERKESLRSELRTIAQRLLSMRERMEQDSGTYIVYAKDYKTLTEKRSEIMKQINALDAAEKDYKTAKAALDNHRNQMYRNDHYVYIGGSTYEGYYQNAGNGTGGNRNVGGTGSSRTVSGPVGSGTESGQVGSGTGGRRTVRSLEEILSRKGLTHKGEIILDTAELTPSQILEDASIPSDLKNAILTSLRNGVARVIIVDGKMTNNVGEPVAGFSTSVREYGVERSVAIINRDNGRAAQELLHEMVHHMLSKISPDKKATFLRTCINSMFQGREDLFKATMKAYLSRGYDIAYGYEKIDTSTNDFTVPDALAYAIYEELVCDLYGGINRFSKNDALQNIMRTFLNDMQKEVNEIFEIYGLEEYSRAKWVGNEYHQTSLETLSDEGKAQTSAETKTQERNNLVETRENTKTTAPEKRKKGTVRFDGANDGTRTYDGIDVENLNKKQKAVVETAKILSDILNLDFSFFHGPAGVGGFYRGGNTIYVNINSGMGVGNFNKVIAAGSLSHELTHWLQRTAPEDYNALRQYIVDDIVNRKGQDELDRLIAQQQRWDGSGKMTRDAAIDEVVANACQTMLSNSKALSELAEQNRSLFEKIHDFLRELVDQIKAAFADVDIQDNAPIYEAARDIEESFDEVLKLWDKALLGAAGKNKTADRTDENNTDNEKIVAEIDATTNELWALDFKDGRYYQAGTDGKNLIWIDRETGKEVSYETVRKRNERIAELEARYEELVDRVTAGKEDLINEGSVGIYDLKDFEDAKETNGGTLFQIFAFEHDEPEYREMLTKWGGMSDDEVDKLFDTVDAAVEIIKDHLEALDYAWETDIDDRGFSPVKPNSDKLYKVSQDFSTLCRKRILQGAIQNQLQAALDRALTREEGIAIRDALMAIQAEGKQIEVACALCYVEFARMRSPAQIQKFLDNREEVIRDFFAGKDRAATKQRIAQAEADEREAIYKEMGLIKGKGADNTQYDVRDAKKAKLKRLPGSIADRIRAAKKAAKANYKPTVAQQRTIDTAKQMRISDFTTPEGLENLAKHHRDLFDAYTSFIRNATNSKGIENDTWWRAGDSRKIGELLIAQMNKENGLRSQSWSDFQVKHLMDYIAATIELATRGAKQHAYTKVPDYVDLMGDTGVMINMSLIPTRDYNGELAYDDVEGFVYKKAMELRKKYHATAGTICIGVKNKQIQQLLASTDIDYVIPYHHSGMAAHIRAAMQIPLWDDYQDFQNEKQLNGSDAKENAETYGVELLSESDPLWHEGPKFSDWFDLERARQIAADVGKKGQYGVMTGGYAAMQDAARRYKEICAERGLAPKFSYGRGNFANEENYWKVLIDRKMVDNVTGDVIEQQKIKPIFSLDTIQRILNDELARYGTVKEDQNEAARRVTKAFLAGDIKAGMKYGEIAKVIQSQVDDLSITNITQSAEDLDKVQHQQWDGVEEEAVNHFGTTTDYRQAGYILQDGRMLDFSGAHWLDGYDDAYIADWRRKNDIRQVDHEDIAEAFEAIDSDFPNDSSLAFIRRGNIRIVPEAPGLELSAKTEPTAEQYRVMRDYIREIASDSTHYPSNRFSVDLTNSRTNRAGVLSYTGTIKPDRIINDLKHFYQTGEIRDTGMQAFYQQWDEDHNDWAPEFYSKLDRVITDWTNGKGQKLPEKMSAQQVVGWLKGKGVKDEEIKWSGIVPYLEGKKTVTQADLQRVMAENEFHIETQVLGATKDSGPYIITHAYGPDRERIEKISGKEEDLKELANSLAEEEVKRQGYDGYYIDDDWYPDGSAIFRVTYQQDGVWDIGAQTLFQADRSNKYGVGTNWPEYTLPGGTNYREILFKLPGSDYINAASTVHWRENAPGTIAHARVQDMLDEHGVPVLFVEEIQSDLHNAGVKRGFSDSSKAIEEFQRLYDEYNRMAYLTDEETEKYVNSQMAILPERDAMQLAQKQVRAKEAKATAKELAEDCIGNVNLYLSTPITEDELVSYIIGQDSSEIDPFELEDILRKVLSEEDYDTRLEVRGIYGSFTSEYNMCATELRSYIREGRIESVPDVPFAGSSDTYHEYVMKHILRMAAEGGYGAVGWTTAQQQVERWSDDFAEGYRIEYDQNIPKFMRKYGKQWGLTVEPINVEVDQEDGFLTERGLEEVWGIYLDKDMTDSVLHEGQAKFSLAVKNLLEDDYDIQDLSTVSNEKLNETLDSLDQREHDAQIALGNIRETWNAKAYENASPEEYTAAYHNWYVSHSMPEYSKKVNLLQNAKKEIISEQDWRTIDADKLMKIAEDLYGTTNDFRRSGFILPNGKMLNMSENGYSRTEPHYEAAQRIFQKYGYKPRAAFSYLKTLIGKGAIRIDLESDGIDIPESGITEEQRNTLRKYLRDFVATDEYGSNKFFVETQGKPGRSNYGEFNPRNTDRILQGIDQFYKTGKFPELSRTAEFHYSLDTVNDPDMDTTENDGKYSIEVTNPETLDMLNRQLENGDVIRTYKSFLEYVDEDGNVNLIAPMAGIQRTEDGKKVLSHALRPGVWEESVGNPNSKSLIKTTNKKGETVWKYKLEKSDVDSSPVPAAFNPYQHSSDVVLNDQFAIAYKRPQLVTYECIIPKSELTSGYWFEAKRNDGEIVKAKDPVGKHSWKTGTVAGKLKETKRSVYLTRWLMPVRKLSDAEVARQYKEILDKESSSIAVPYNVVPPGLLTELAKIGVPIDYNGSEAKYQKDGNEAKKRVEYELQAERDVKAIENKYSLAGPSAKEADLGKLDKAIQMELDGEFPGEIWYQTGWYRGVDNKWRFEIDDSQYFIPEEIFDDQLLIRKEETDPESLTYWEEMRLEGLSQDPPPKYQYDLERFLETGDGYFREPGKQTSRLFSNYPELRYVTVRFGKLKGNIIGQFDAGKNEITLSWNLLDLDGEDRRKQVLSVLMHEIQHAIQRIEGFASGSNPDYWKYIKSGNLVAYTPKDMAQQYIMSFQKTMGKETVDDLYDIAELREQITNRNTTTSREQALRDYDQKLKAMVDKIGPAATADMLNQITLYGLTQYADHSGDTDFDLYQKTAGEIEARTVQSRLNLDQESRKVVSPYTGPMNVVFTGVDHEGNATSTTRFSLDSAVDQFGDEVATDLTPADLSRATPSELSNDLVYTKGKAVMRTESGDTVVLDDISEDSEAARYYQVQEAKNAYNTRTEPFIIPPKDRYEHDGRNLREQDAGLRRGSEEVSPEYQEGALRRPGSISERNAQGGSPSEESQGVRYSLVDNPQTADYYPYGSFERAYIEAAQTNDLAAFATQLNKMLDRQDRETNMRGITDIAELVSFLPMSEEERRAVLANIQELGDKYGWQKPSAGKKQQYVIPAKVDKHTRTMRTTQNIAQNAETEWLSEEMLRESITNEALAYVPNSDKKAVDKAYDVLSNKSYKGALNIFNAKVESGERVTKDDVALGEVLLKEAEAQGDVRAVMKLAADLTVMGHEIGQALQAYRILNKLTPRGQMYYLQKVADKLNKEYAKKIARGKMKKIVLDPAVATKILAAQTREELDAAIAEAQKSIADQIPVTFADRWNAWRYLAMLGNPRTHIRNLLGNGVFAPAVFIKDVIARGLESKFVDPSTRTRMYGANLRKDSPWMRYAEQDAAIMQEILTGNAKGNKFTNLNEILSKRDIWGTNPFGKTIDKLANFNDEMLNKEDAVFLNVYYKRSLAEFLQARGVTEDDLRHGFGGDRDSRKLLNEARTWAIREAQRNTYRDANGFASTLNQLKKKNKVAYVLLEGLVPFTKTPANIAVRGFEYSPLGLIKSIYEMSQDLKAGVPVSETIDKLAAGMTGTAIALLGFLLAGLGHLRGAGPDDEKEREFEELQGHQNWSIEFGGISYTIDWMAPAALPLFIGCSIYEMLTDKNDEGLTFSEWMTAMSRIIEPMSSLTMLDGINSTLRSIAYSQDRNTFSTLAGSMLTSYLGQGVPTLFGQIARSIDSDRRTTYVDKNSKLTPAMQRFIQSSIQAKIPGWANQRMAYVDMWGRTDSAETVGDYILRAFENFMSPGYINKLKTTDVDEELNRLYHATSEGKILPTTVAKYFPVNGERKDLTAKEYETLAKTVGQTRYAMLQEAFNTEMYQSLSDDDKLKVVENIYSYADDASKFDLDPGFKKASWIDIATKVGATDYCLLRSDLMENKSNEKLFRYLATNPELTEAQVGYLIADKYSAPEEIRSVSNTGYVYTLDEADEDAMEELFGELIADRLPVLKASEEYRNASGDEQGVMLNNLYAQAQSDVKEYYGSSLDQSGRSMTLGKASAIGKEAFHMVLETNNGDTAAQAKWIGDMYRADSSIHNPAHTGYDVVLNKDQKKQLEKEFRTAWDTEYQKLVTSKEFQSAPNQEYRENMIADHYNALAQKVEDEYAQKLYQSGKAEETFGTPSRFTWQEAYAVAKSEIKSVDEQAKWLGQKWSTGSTITNPDRASYEIQLTGAQQAEIKADFEKTWEARYKTMVTDPAWSSLTLKQQESRIYGLQKDVATEVENAYARKLISRGYYTEAVNLRASSAAFNQMLSAEKLTKEQRIDLIGEKYLTMGLTTITNPEAKEVRYNAYMDYIRKNYDAYIKHGTEAEFDKLRSKAGTASGNALKSYYHVKRISDVPGYDYPEE